MAHDQFKLQNNDNPLPIPPSERDLPTIQAEPLITIPLDKKKPPTNILEGLNFDTNGNLYICSPPHGDIYRFNIAKHQLRLFRHLPDHMLPSALKVHRDGRLFVTAAWSDHGCQVAVLDPRDGHVIKTLANLKSRMFDDLTFDQDGGFYLSDLSGTIAKPSAGIFYVEPDEQTVHPVIESGMIATGGICLLIFS